MEHQSRTEERHEIIMKEYEKVLKELKEVPPMGDMAPHVSRKFIYDLVAKRLNGQWSVDHIKTVIIRRSKKRQLHN